MLADLLHGEERDVCDDSAYQGHSNVIKEQVSNARDRPQTPWDNFDKEISNLSKEQTGQDVSPAASWVALPAVSDVAKRLTASGIWAAAISAGQSSGGLPLPSILANTA